MEWGTIVWITLFLFGLWIIRKRLTKRERHYKFSEISDSEKNVICKGVDDIFQFNAHVLNTTSQISSSSGTEIILTPKYLLWSVKQLRWRILEVNDILGSKMASQQQNKNEYIVSTCSYSLSDKKYFKNGRLLEAGEQNDTSYFFLLKFLRIIVIQMYRLMKIILYGNDSSDFYHVKVDFLFAKGEMENSSASSKLQSTRFHRILLHFLERSYSEHSKLNIENALKSAIHIPEPTVKRNIKLIVNPLSGNRQSKQILEMLYPFLDAASERINYNVQFTEYREHGKRIAAELDYSEYDAIVCIGGDGMVYEAVNGMMECANAEEICKKVKLGVIPAGTGNGLSASLGHFSIAESIIPIIRGSHRPLDIMRVHQEGNPMPPLYCCLQASYGMIADVDFDSEGLRFLGELRFTVYALYLLLNLRRYPIRIRFTPEKIKMVKNNKVYYEDNDQNTPFEYEGPMLWIAGLNTKYLSKDFIGAPDSQIDDGLIYMVLVSSFSRFRLFKLLFDMTDGTHPKYSKLQMFSTKSFELTGYPFQNRSIRLDCDGEPVIFLPGKSIHVEMIPGLCNIFV